MSEKAKKSYRKPSLAKSSVSLQSVTAGTVGTPPPTTTVD
jgi:hypothetical protein